MIMYMRLIFFRKIAHGGQNGIWRRVSEAAKGRIFDGVSHLLKKCQMLLGSPSGSDFVQNLQGSFQADAAGHALSAGFIHREVQKEPGHIHHAGACVHDDHPAGTHDGAGLLMDS
jgi:hypothetical protein